MTLYGGEGRCETCRYWSDADAIYTRGFGTCARAEIEFCELAYPDTLMRAKDPELCRDGVLTKPDFGCVMYEARP